MGAINRHLGQFLYVMTAESLNRLQCAVCNATVYHRNGTGFQSFRPVLVVILAENYWIYPNSIASLETLFGSWLILDVQTPEKCLFILLVMVGKASQAFEFNANRKGCTWDCGKIFFYCSTILSIDKPTIRSSRPRWVDNNPRCLQCIVAILALLHGNCSMRQQFGIEAIREYCFNTIQTQLLQCCSNLSVF